ncbi:uncharacterized protein F4822DRAFT_279659 [Hypoxylon trugodes]|uniref:uncharacterized protein n=1 Tax=Hypoxylon trugodes TaxID=326681 RepID=UPI002192D01D|nr:uncharacterized protein F4822DRAFT_279659 [Hypoxylon trugodes]KAI1387343.1 hypothetical protein F4822DRAFT_279659 [Hypoxylon trugodes]
MCRKIIIHQMHHDVRIPMICDVFAEQQEVYANPRRTRYHQCELSHPPPGQLLLNTWYPTCEYHSCCMPIVEITCCDAGLRYDDDDHEPEECDYFVLEHKHERLEYFGCPEDYPVSYCPATWSNDIYEIDRNWDDWYREDWERLYEWEEVLFQECETIYILEEEAKTHFLVWRDLNRWRNWRDRLLVQAEIHVEQAQKRLIDQKELVSRMFNWGRGDGFVCSSGFVPIWWMRLWAEKEDMYGELNGVKIRPENLQCIS